ncbi:MAG: AraC family transcriptional regulator [Burkholderiaceae bacterium]
MTQSLSLMRWSTDAEAPRHRMDLYIAFLNSLQAPMQLSAPRHEEFEAQVKAAELGTILVFQQNATPHNCLQDRRDQARSESRNYHLLLSLSTPWDAEHRDTHHFEPGDAMLFDVTLPWKISHARVYEVINIKLSDAWLRRWVPSPAVLVGRPLRAGAGWGRALAGFAAQLSPDFFVHSPLPHSVVIDHLGVLLALSASQLSGPSAKAPSPALESLAARISDCVDQRCCEPGLTAELVAQSVGVSVRTLHRCLASQQRYFGTELVAARADTAVRMLSSPMFCRLTIAEIARRAGFIHASHFSRVLRARTGRSPSELRRGFEKMVLDED